jgi:hypothetical protein
MMCRGSLTFHRLPSVREENRHGWTCKHAFGGSPYDKLSDPRVPVCPHYQKIGIPIRYMRFKHITDTTSFGLDFVEYHIDAVSRQMLRKLPTGPPGVDGFFFGHGKNTNAFRFPQN